MVEWPWWWPPLRITGCQPASLSCATDSRAVGSHRLDVAPPDLEALVATRMDDFEASGVDVSDTHFPLHGLPSERCDFLLDAFVPQAGKFIDTFDGTEGAVTV